MSSLRSLLVFSISTIMALAVSGNAYGVTKPKNKKSCAATVIPEYGSLKDDFEHDTDYLVEILERTPIKDQMNMGTCHLHSWAANLERSYFLRTGKTVELSASYLTAMYTYRNAVGTLGHQDVDWKLYLGSTPLNSYSAIGKIGLVPESIWKPARQFYKNPLADQLETFLQNIITRAKLDMEDAPTPEVASQMKMQANQEIMQLLFTYTGEIPQQFEFEGAIYDPVRFAQTQFPELGLPLVEMRVSDDRDVTEYEAGHGRHVSLATSIDTVEDTVVKLIDMGYQVTLSYEHEAAYVDKKTGIMSIAAFLFPSSARPLSRLERTESQSHRGGHQVEIVGYDRDPRTGEVSKFKVKNSWGKKTASAGYYHMYRDFFRAFSKGITFTSKPEIELPLATPVSAPEPSAPVYEI
ncbi:MAG: C1 family peptidase [Bdellovibrionota bacterium]